MLVSDISWLGYPLMLCNVCVRTRVCPFINKKSSNNINTPPSPQKNIDAPLSVICFFSNMSIFLPSPIYFVHLTP
jgi:hypothetical protein